MRHPAVLLSSIAWFTMVSVNAAFGALRIEIELPKVTFVLGEPIAGRVLILNDGKHTLTVPKDPFYYLTVQRKESDGSWAPCRSDREWGKRLIPIPEGPPDVSVGSASAWNQGG
jgi:hypothetical protein